MATHTEALEKNALAMVAPGKGILAADESTGTIAKRLKSIGVESTQDKRRAWRETLFGAEDALRAHISGAILFDETIRTTKAVELLTRAGTLVGIKVDTGVKPLAGGAQDETITEGLDGLSGRLEEYHMLGARFAKWRAVLRIGKGAPSRAAIDKNAEALAHYAALCQAAGLVPIVEPEVLMDGAHDITRCAEATEATLIAVYRELHAQGVHLEGTILKPNMVLAGADAQQESVHDAADATLGVLRRCVPAAVPGIAFLSGGQTEAQATEHLNAINAQSVSAPWKLTFSYGRALQASALAAWGKDENTSAAQAQFAHRAALNGLATRGRWTPEAEKAS